MIYINNGIKLSSGMPYVLEARELLPVVLSAEEIGNGFRLKAEVEENSNIRSYSFYIEGELYKIVSTGATEEQVDVTDKDFGEYECYVQVNKTGGVSDSSPNIIAENYYIKNANDMQTFQSMVNEGNNFVGKRVKVIADIDLGGSEQNRNWIPIGTETTSICGLSRREYLLEIR